MLHVSETIPAQTSEPNHCAANASTNIEIVARNRYAVGGEIAQGGIGRILQASDKRLERQVALKELLDPTPESEARFLREALVTAKLQHPAIVPVYDVGRFPNGEIFYSMKLVSGRSLGDVIDDAGTFQKRLALLPHVIAVAEAIAYAHTERIVHRDLKPANVLVGPFGETVVIDWGIAKDLREIDATNPAIALPIASDTAPDSTSSLTMAGAVLGTPGYMPPEQAAGEPVDERADVYALGSILYHLLAGVPPYDGKSGLEVLTKVLTEPPAPLSMRERGVPPDLLAIVSKAMARDPVQRYPTANEFAHDLHRFQTGQIVRAYNYSHRERAWRFVQKHRAAMVATAVGLGLTSIVAFTSLSRVLAARSIAEMERDRANEESALAAQKQSEAETARRKALQQSDELLLIQARNAARRDPNEAIAWLSSLSDTFQRWGEARLIAADAKEYGIAKLLRGHTAVLNMVTYSHDGTLIATASDDRTAAIWNAHGKLLRKLEGHTDEVWRVIFMKDDKRLLTTSKDGTARLWDVNTGQPIDVIHSGGPGIYWTQLLHDESHLALTNCSKNRIEIHNIETKAVESLPGDVRCPSAFQLSHDGRNVAYAAHGNVRLFNLDARTFRDYKSPNGRCDFVAIAPNASHVACAGLKGNASLWDVKTGHPWKHLAPRNITELMGAQFSGDDKFFIYSQEAKLNMIDLERRSIRTFHDHKRQLFTAFFSPSNRWLVTTSHDRTAIVRDLVTDTQRPLHGFHDTTSWAAFSPDEQNLVVSSWDHTAKIFSMGASRNRVIAQGQSPMTAAQFSADGRSLMSIQENGTLHIDSAMENHAKTTVVELEGEKHAISSDGRFVAYGTKSGAIRIHAIGESRNDVELAGHEKPIMHLQWSTNGQWLVSFDTDNIVQLWDVASGRTRIKYAAKHAIKSVAFSKDTSIVAMGDTQGVIHLFSTAGNTERTLEGHAADVNALAFLPDGNLVSGGHDHTLRIWDLATGKARSLDASGLGIIQVMVSQDGTTLYSLGGESNIRRWNVDTGHALPIMRGHDEKVIRIDLSPDGSRLISAGSDGELRLWDLASGQSRSLDGHHGEVRWIRFSPQGNTLASVGDDRTTRLWYDDLPFDERGLRAWMSNAVPVAMDLPLKTD